MAPRKSSNAISMSQPSSNQDAIDLLKQDHRAVEALFQKFEQEHDDEAKVQIAQEICLALMIHTEVEERLFYPVARKSIEGEEASLVDEAAVEHRSIRQLIQEIDGSSSRDGLFEANVKVLKEYVSHHVHEEENELMPEMQSAGIDLMAMGRKILELKEELSNNLTRGPGRRTKGRVALPRLPERRRGAQARGAASGTRARAAARGRTAKPAGRTGGRGRTATGGARAGTSSARAGTSGARAGTSSARAGTSSARAGTSSARAGTGARKSARANGKTAPSGRAASSRGSAKRAPSGTAGRSSTAKPRAGRAASSSGRRAGASSSRRAGG